MAAHCFVCLTSSRKLDRQRKASSVEQHPKMSSIAARVEERSTAQASKEVDVEECLEEGVLLLTLALAHDRRLARDLNPVCQALAGHVVEGCSLVKCSVVDDLTALLASPRWVGGGSKTVTALRVTASTGHFLLKPEPAATAGANPLQVWLNSAEQLGNEDVDALFSLAPKCPELRVLSVHNAISDDVKDDVEYLLQPLIDAAPHWPQLQHVALCRTTLGPDLGQALAACAPHWPALQRLDLVRNDLGPDGAEALTAAAQHWPRLQSLSLADNNIAVKGATALATGGQYWPRLQDLDLAYNELGDEGVEVLAGAGEQWKHLRSLDLQYNDLGLDAAQALATAAKHCQQLQQLVLRNNRLGPDGAHALVAAAEHLKQLQLLDLGANNCGTAALKGLVEAVPHWKEHILA